MAAHLLADPVAVELLSEMRKSWPGLRDNDTWTAFLRSAQAFFSAGDATSRERMLLAAGLSAFAAAYHEAKQQGAPPKVPRWSPPKDPSHD